MADVAMVNHHTFQSGATATGAGTAMDVGGLSGVGIQVEGISTATITFEANIDGTNWVAIRARNRATTDIATTATADGLYWLPCAGLNQVRARISAYTSGTINVFGVGTYAGSTVE